MLFVAACGLVAQLLDISPSHSLREGVMSSLIVANFDSSVRGFA
jgi:hypothetical protein